MDRQTREVTFMETTLNIPYYSQYRDVEDRDQRLTACGMTCVYMVLEYYGIQGETLEELVQEGIQKGGYGASGWVHDYLVSLFQKVDIECERKENMRDGDVKTLHLSLKAGNPVIVSAQRRMFDRRIFHMVLLTGYRETAEGNLEGFFYHDPASLREEDGKHQFVPIPTFLLDWRRMAIFPTKNGGMRE